LLFERRTEAHGLPDLRDEQSNRSPHLLRIHLNPLLRRQFLIAVGGVLVVIGDLLSAGAREWIRRRN
jgi:hypothetical protein